MLNLSWYNPFFPYLNGNFTCNLETKAFTILAVVGFEPRATGNMSAPLPSELSRHVDIICSIIIWTLSVCVWRHYLSRGWMPFNINAYLFHAVRCHPSINMLVKWHLVITERNQSSGSRIGDGSSVARWWNPECVNHLEGVNISLS